VLATVPAGALAQSASPAVEPGTPSTEIVLQMDVCCGFTPLTYSLLSMPVFTLYADGTAIFRPSEGGTFDAPPALLKAQLSPEQMDALLDYAAGPGGLAQAKDRYDEMFVTDMPTTTFTIATDELQKVVSVYALGMDQMEPNADTPVLQQLAALGATLSQFDAQAAADNVVSLETYQPDRYLLTLFPDMSLDGPVAPDWPFTDVEVPTATDENGWVRQVLTPEQVAQVTDVPSGGIGDLMFTTADGDRMQVVIRPMLPHEVDPTAR
jgi:hypothetical protein